MYEFAYHRPASVADAAALLGKAADPKILGGGMTLLPTLKQRLASPSDLVDVGSLKDLAYIRQEGGTLVIGAATRHADVAASDVVAKAIPALAQLASGIGDQQVRHRGTIGGSIANADPSADYPAAVVGLGATVVTDRREIPGDAFFKGLFETALEANEIVTAVKFPLAEKAAYAKFPNPASRYAIVGVFVARTGGAWRVAVTGAGGSVFRVAEMEAALGRSATVDSVAGIKVPAAKLNSDLHATAEYRAHLVTVMTKRAVAALG